jgi:hypothetical protein
MRRTADGFALVMLDLPTRRRIRRDELCRVLCSGPPLGSVLAPPEFALPPPDLPRRGIILIGQVAACASRLPTRESVSNHGLV